MDLFDGIDLDDVSVSNSKPPVNPEYDDSGGDWDDDGYESLDDKKTKEQIRKLKIENEKALKALVEKDLVISILSEVGQSIQSNFVDQAKRKAYTWANQLGIPEKERELESLISDMNEEGIVAVMNHIKTLCDDGVFE